MSSILLTTMRGCSRRFLYTVSTSIINSQTPTMASCTQCTKSNKLGYQFHQQFITNRSISITSAIAAEKTEDVLTNLDKIRQRQKRLLEQPEETEAHEIYVGPLAKQIRSLKFFSLTTTGMGLMMQPILIQKSSEIPIMANVAVFGMVGFFTFVTPILIHFLAKKYVTAIVYDPMQDKYVATTYSLFMQKRQIEFKADDLKVPEIPGPFTTFTVNTGEKDKKSKRVPLFIVPEAFVKTSHYGRFMGYDKPIDLHLTTVESTDDDKSSSSNRSSSNTSK